jgi:hypothetical protein
MNVNMRSPTHQRPSLRTDLIETRRSLLRPILPLVCLALALALAIAEPIEAQDRTAGAPMPTPGETPTVGVPEFTPTPITVTNSISPEGAAERATAAPSSCRG